MKLEDIKKAAKKVAQEGQLILTGGKIDAICKIVQGKGESIHLGIIGEGITEKELEEFSEYLYTQETTMPIFEPTAWMRGGREALQMGRNRCSAVQALVAILNKET